MEWSAESARRQKWTERLRRFEGSGLTVVAFCERENVSTPSFYQWRRKLGLRLDGRVRAAQNGRRDGRLGTNSNSGAPPAFVPVQIRQSAVVRMRLPNGVQVWLPANDAALLASAIAAAGGLAAIGREASTC